MLPISKVFAQAASSSGRAEQTSSEAVSSFSGLLQNLPYWIASIVMVVIFFFIAKVLAGRVADFLTRQQEEYATLDQHKGVIILAERITFFLTLIIGVVVALGVSGLLGDLGWLLGSLGLAIGFALQGFIANFVSGIFLLAQERTKLGNYIEVDIFKGIITEIGIRATTIQTFSGVEIMIPNRTFFEKPVSIYTSNIYRRIEIPVGVDYGTDLQKAIEVILEVIAKHEDVLKDHPQDVLVTEFANSSINLEARFWILSKSAWWKIKSDIVHRVKIAFDKNGIVIPFPHRTLKIDAGDPSIEGMVDYMKGKSSGGDPSKFHNTYTPGSTNLPNEDNTPKTL